MDAKSKRIAELLAKASQVERKIFNACLTTGAHLRLVVNAPSAAPPRIFTFTAGQLGRPLILG